MEINQITSKVIACAIEVHKVLGPGLLESAYEECLAFELASCNLHFERQKPIPVVYKDIKLECGYRADFIVAGQVLLELKSVDSILPVHDAQVLTYLKFSHKEIGLLINFNVCLLKTGIKRFRI